MSESAATFHAIISVIDKFSAPLHALNGQLKDLHHPFAPLHDAAHRFGQELASFAEHSGLSKIADHAREGRKAVGELRDKLTELLGPLAIIGATGSLAGIFSVEKEAAAFGANLYHAAEKIGVTTEALGGLRYAAGETGVAAESLDGGLAKLNRGLALAAGGKNKDFAAMLAALGIAVRDAQGHIRSAADVAPELADAFARIHNPALRARMAVASFGKTGQDLIPMMAKGGAALRHYLEEAVELGVAPSAAAAKQAMEAEVAWKRLGHAAEGLKFAIGSGVFESINKIVDAMTKWIVANRVWLAGKVKEKVEALGEALSKIDWAEIGKVVLTLGKAFGFLASSTTGIYAILGGGAALMAAPFIASILDIGAAVGGLTLALGGPLVKAFGLAGGAGAAAAAKMNPGGLAAAAHSLDTVAGSAGTAATEIGGLAAVLGPLVAALAAIGATMVALKKATDFDKAHGGVGSTEAIRSAVGLGPAPEHPPANPKAGDLLDWMKEKASGWNWQDGLRGKDFAHRLNQQRAAREATDRDLPGDMRARAAPSPLRLHEARQDSGDWTLDAGRRGILSAPLPPRAAAPAPAQSGEVKVTVDINNAPPGTKVQTAAAGAAAKPDVAVGYAFGGDPVGAF